jgi:hypothetical protein
VRVAWLRPPAASTPDPLDDTAALIDELRAVHHIDIVDERHVHDLVWQHARHPFDLIVYEMANTRAHAFVAPYAIHFPGVLMLRSFAAHYPRAIRASRTVVAGDEVVAQSLADHYPGVDVRYAPVGVAAQESGSPDRPSATPTRFGLFHSGRIGVIAGAAARAREAGAQVEVVTGSPDHVLRNADVIVALEWPPPARVPITALAAMAAGRPVVVFESLVTAALPALNPQDWQPRGYIGGARVPVAISIDPRDEEHSLMRVMKRLGADGALRASLGSAARAWWRDHATLAHAVEAWHRILETAGLPPHPPFAGADGAEHARVVLATFGVKVDFL